MSAGPRTKEQRGRAIAAVALALALAGLALALGSARAQEAPSAPPTFASSDVTIDEILEAMRHAHPDNFRPIGSTSLTFQMQLAGSIDAAWRPETVGQRRGWLAEVAAWRIAERLGLDSVPPSIVRTVDRGRLNRHLDPEAAPRADALLGGLVRTGSGVRGSATYWIPNLSHDDELDGPEGLARWGPWLRIGAVVPPEDAALARDLSNAFAFDVVIGNGDRASGANLRTVENHGVVRLAIRDHNLAFPTTPSDLAWEHMMRGLIRTRRFSRSFVERLEALDEAAVRDAVSDPEVGMLLDDEQIAGVMARRQTVLSWIGSLCEEHGEDAVLSMDPP